MLRVHSGEEAPTRDEVSLRVPREESNITRGRGRVNNPEIQADADVVCTHPQSSQAGQLFTSFQMGTIKAVQHPKTNPDLHVDHWAIYPEVNGEQEHSLGQL